MLAGCELRIYELNQAPEGNLVRQFDTQCARDFRSQ